MFNQFFGIYKASVVNDQDPEARHRLQLLVPSVLGAQTISNWALPCVPSGYATWPAIGSVVWAAFEGGDINHPVWLGTLP